MKQKKLSPEDVAEIRRRCTDEQATQPALAVAFGVSRSMISMIVSGKRHTGGPGRIYTRQAEPEDRVCRICHERKLIEEFPRFLWKRRNGYSWRDSQCRDCNRRRIQANRVEQGLHGILHRRDNQARFRAKLRDEVFAHYGGCCACCGESRANFLSIDHIDGGGKQHRKEIGGGNVFYRWVRRNNFPSNLRLLCFSCNHASARFGRCPHESLESQSRVSANRSSMRYYRVRRLVLDHYGGRCFCCGETRDEFLSLDHMDNSGAEHRRNLHGDLYHWARRNGYPSVLRIACINCNLARGFHGTCPHELDRTTSVVPPATP